MNLKTRYPRGPMFPALAAALLICIFAGCKKDQGSGELLVTPDGEITLAASGEIKSILIVTDSKWSVSVSGTDTGWLKYTTTERNLVLTPDENIALTQRTATVTISAGSASRKLTVTQKGQPQTITITPSTLPSVPAAGREYDIEVAHTPFVELKYNLGPGVDWIVLGALADGVLKITVQANTGSRRSGTIVFSDNKGNASSVALNVIQLAEGQSADDLIPEGYVLRSSMKADPSHAGLGFADAVWTSVHDYMRTKGWDYSEHPNNASGDHGTETHIAVEWDEELGQNVFHLFSHSRAGAIDGDRGPAIGGDRMRNEMKSRTGNGWHEMNGNHGEWQILEWKMKIPRDWQPTGSFCHIHQLKGQDGTDIGSPLITITLRYQGGVRHLEVIHTPRSGGTKVPNPVDNILLDDIEDQWLQIQQEVNFQRNGVYRIRITKVSDGAVIVNKTVNNIDTWRASGCIDVRNKFGIYRSYDLDGDLLAGQLPNLKDESIYLADFKVYEKPESSNNTNPVAVND